MAAMLWPITLMPFTLLPMSSQGWPEGSVLIPAMPDILGSCCHACPSSVVSNKAPIASVHIAASNRLAASLLVIRKLRSIGDIVYIGRRRGAERIRWSYAFKRKWSYQRMPDGSPPGKERECGLKDKGKHRNRPNHYHGGHG